MAKYPIYSVLKQLDKTLGRAIFLALGMVTPNWMHDQFHTSPVRKAIINRLRANHLIVNRFIFGRESLTFTELQSSGNPYLLPADIAPDPQIDWFKIDGCLATLYVCFAQTKIHLYRHIDSVHGSYTRTGSHRDCEHINISQHIVTCIGNVDIADPNSLTKLDKLVFEYAQDKQAVQILRVVAKAAFAILISLFIALLWITF